MSKLATGAVFALVSTCNSQPQQSSTPDYTCDSVYDTACRYTAHVVIEAGTLEDAGTFEDDGWGTEGSFRDLRGRVTIDDALGVPASCIFTGSLDIGTLTDGTTATVTAVQDIEFDPGCPMTCAWFLPASGSFDDTAGRYSLSPSGGSWSLQLGDWAPEAPYSREWLATASSQTTYGAQASLNAPVGVVETGWSVPVSAPSGTVFSTCP